MVVLTTEGSRATTPSPTWRHTQMMHNQSVNMNLSLENRRAKAAFNAEAAEGVVMEVESATDLQKMNKYNQADASMHTLVVHSQYNPPNANESSNQAPSCRHNHMDVGMARGITGHRMTTSPLA